MSIISKPMLASACDDIIKLDFENNRYIATPKLDGIRALKIDGDLVSRTFKQIRNNHIRDILLKILPDNADGEIVCPGAFQKTSSGVMGSQGQPNFKYFWFDYVTTDLEMSYEQRLEHLDSKFEQLTDEQKAFIVPLIPDHELDGLLMCVNINSLEDLQEYEAICLDAGYEGVILRTHDSPYKCGRATAKQEWLLKIKQFADDEAEIIGFGEKMHNNNPAEKDNFGRTKRSTATAGLSPAGTLGYLEVKDIKSGIKFEIGTGFDDELRQEIWDNRPSWLGLIVKYKHFAISGVKEKPRFPVFLGIRHLEDMS